MTPKLEDRYKIVDDDRGPLISESRVTVFDVLAAQQNGAGLYEVCMVFNLTPLQVQTAFDYIEAHRQALETELIGIQERQRAIEQSYRAQAASIERTIIAQPPTPQRSALQVLRERSVYEYLVTPNADSTQRPQL